MNYTDNTILIILILFYFLFFLALNGTNLSWAETLLVLTYDLSLLARLYNRVGSHIGFSASATFWAPYFLKADLLLLLFCSWR